MKQSNLTIIAKTTGFWYLLLAVFGVLGFLVLQPQIFIDDQAEKTLNNLITNSSGARIRLLLELLIIASQALVAVWFYKLFKDLDAWRAFAIAAWGLLNSAAIMISAIAMASAIEIAHAASPIFNEKTVIIHPLMEVMAKSWVVGGLFFGLWLIPMGGIVVKSACMPLWLGRILIIGGFGYILSTTLNLIGFSNPFVEALTIPATIGEFWMIGYLLTFGIRPLEQVQPKTITRETN